MDDFVFCCFLEFDETLQEAKLPWWLHGKIVRKIGCKTLSEFRDPKTWGSNENEIKEKMGPQTKKFQKKNKIIILSCIFCFWHFLQFLVLLENSR